MDLYVFTAVLVAAACHAGWNAIVKIDLDRFLSITLIALASGVVGLCFVPFVDIPSAPAWPPLLLSVVLHTGYNLFLIEAYKAGDLGQVYPVARGSAPLIVSIVAVVFLGEPLTLVAGIGIVLLVLGVWLMSVRGGRDLAKLESRAIAFALGTSVFIASYTLTDGMGARLNNDPHGYAVWLFVLDGFAMLAVLVARRGWQGLRAMQPYWKSGFAGGGMSIAAYWIVIWATTMAPIALVAALREASVLFATAISVFILREPLSRWRITSAMAIVAGIVLLKAS